MGILDDAIREHLELKRSHGASDDEIRRKEVEAFGRPRPEEAAQAPEGDHTQTLSPDETMVAEPPGLADLEPLQPAPEDPYAVHPGDDLVPDPDVPHAAHEEQPPPAAEAGAGTLEPTEIETGPPTPPSHHDHHDEPHPALVDHDHIGGEEHAPEPVFRQSAETPTAPPDAPLDPAPVEDPPVGDPPVQNPDIDEPPPRQSPEQAGDDEDEDVLEETPEFLQDAPEHDRLWFEQKPPRDFDFGE
jgi:hypothetical protein